MAEIFYTNHSMMSKQYDEIEKICKMMSSNVAAELQQIIKKLSSVEHIDEISYAGDGYYSEATESWFIQKQEHHKCNWFKFRIITTNRSTSLKTTYLLN